jgi:hypothetical protein
MGAELDLAGVIARTRISASRCPSAGSSGQSNNHRVSEQAQYFHRIDTEYWVPRFRGA